jgi:uroporphyrinogen decarboxylase
LPDGTITFHKWVRMPPASNVFTGEHAGCGVDLSADIPVPDVERHRAHCESCKLTPDAAAQLVDFCHRVRAASNNRAVFAAMWQIQSGMGIGMGMYPLQCVLYPDEVYACHAASADRCIHNMRVLLPLIRDDIDILMLTADDWGTQTSLVASPDVHRNLFKPHYKRMNAAAHEFAPRLKTFIHTCGAVYPLIKDFAEAGFDIMNPVQWSAGEQSPAEWKAAADGKIAFWGGGVNAQHTLPLRSVAEVRAEVRRVVPELSKGGGYIFANTHNILAEIAAEKVVAMYEEARKM